VFAEPVATRRLLFVTTIAVFVAAAAVNVMLRVTNEFNVAVNESATPFGRPKVAATVMSLKAFVSAAAFVIVRPYLAAAVA
jgi:hypothetical protein